jgi:hypothetical protein
VTVAAAALALVVVSPTLLAQDEAGQDFCGLFTAKEIKSATGSKVEPAPGYGSCDWWASGSRGSITSLNAAWNDVAQDDWDYLFPSLEPLTVGGSPAWYGADEYSAALLLEVGSGILLLNAGLADGADARDGLVQLGELAIERAGSLPEPPEVPEPGAEAPADTGATDAMAAAFCAVLSADEVAAVAGGAVAEGAPTIATEGGCEWVGGDLDDFIYVSAAWDPQTLTEAQTIEGESLSIDGRPGWFSSALGAGLLYLELDQGLLALTAEAAEGVDPKAALTSLAEMVVSRSGSLVAPPVATAPPAGGSEALEGLFPESIGGQPLSVISVVGEEALATLSNGAVIRDAVSAGGGDPAKVAIAFGSTADGGQVIALGLDGVDAASVLPLMLERPDSASQMELAGKAVTKQTQEGSEPGYGYAKDDVLWIVVASEATAEEILAALP